MARTPGGQGAFDFGVKAEPLPRAAAPTPAREEIPPLGPEIVRQPTQVPGTDLTGTLREERLREIADRLAIQRPLAFLDLETTGTSVERDRIVEVSVIIVAPGGRVTRFASLVNPGVPIPEGATEVHGIGDDDVQGAPFFSDFAPQLARDLAACDLCGFNLRRFDLKLLAAEFARADVWFNPDEARVVDAMTIFHLNEKRDLEAAVKFYCSRQHHGHRAEEDVLATIDVLHAQVMRYEELPKDVPGLDTYCRGTKPDWLSKDGRIAWRDGAARITFGKHNGKSLQDIAKEFPDYLRWIADKDFPEDTKRIAMNALQGVFPMMPPPAAKP